MMFDHLAFLTILGYLIIAPATTAATPLPECQGPCVRDRDCELGLVCWKKDFFAVPGCIDVDPSQLLANVTTQTQGYCHRPPPGTLVRVATHPKRHQLSACQGLCRHDGQCDYGLSCWRRHDMTPVPGCDGRGQKGWDYCYEPEPGTLVVLNDEKAGVPRHSLLACQGECRRDEDCDWGLVCSSRFRLGHSVAGCTGRGAWESRYCFQPTESNALILVQPNPTTRLGMCQGKCWDDTDCQVGLVCHKRADDEPVPGCAGSGQPKLHYCGRPVNNRQLVLAANLEGHPESAFPLLPCQGHCIKDDDCIGDYVCVSRTELQPIVPGCMGTGSSFTNRSYCSAVTYVPGHGTTLEHGLRLSRGLTARILARAGQRVRLRGSWSQESFHSLPDGATVFVNPDGSGGWAYVSNSEHNHKGGVGAIYFDSQGRVINYERLLNATKRNCGGGKTFWNTYLSCEERKGGSVWEVDPWKRTARRTVINRAVGELYESAAYDNRNASALKVFVTMDTINGPLLRFSPNPKVLQEALQSQNYSNVLHRRPGTTFEYLVVVPDGEFDASCDSHLGSGTFFWTKNRTEASENAMNYYKYAEGLDIRDGRLYMTTKADKLLFILNLDDETFDNYSLLSGAFDSQPDQIASLLREKHYTDGQLVQEDRPILYFCEDGRRTCGIHARDMDGKLYTVLQAVDPRYLETTGLAFSPDSRYMYVSFQVPGIIFEIKRKDNFPFRGGVLDIKYHQDAGNDWE